MIGSLHCDYTLLTLKWEWSMNIEWELIFDSLQKNAIFLIGTFDQSAFMDKLI
jgi:hypothetical protein